MDKSQFMQKVDELLKEMVPAARKDCGRLFDSGAVDTAAFENDYALPKIILTAALQNQADHYYPLHPDHRIEVANLAHF